MLEIAAEFEEAGHESWEVDAAEEAAMRNQIPTRTAGAGGGCMAQVTFRDFCLYAEYGEEYVDININESVKRLSQHAAGSNGIDGSDSGTVHGGNGGERCTIASALAHLGIDVLSATKAGVRAVLLPHQLPRCYEQWAMSNAQL